MLWMGRCEFDPEPAAHSLPCPEPTMPMTRFRPLVVIALAFVAATLSPSTVPVARAQVLSGKPAPKLATTGVATAQIKFESSLAVGTIAQPNIAAPLSWSAYSGATSYHVLRYASASSAPVSVASMSQTQYTAHVLPGNSFVFRVVAYNSAGQPVDTTKAVSFATAAAPAQTQLATTCTQNNGALTLGWNTIANSDDYSVTIDVQQKRDPRGGAPPPDTLVNSIVTTTTFNTTMTGPTVLSYDVIIRANFTLHDYPTAGKVTRVPVETGGMSEVHPYGPPGACKPPPPK